MIGKRDIDEALIQRLIEILNDNGLTEIEVGVGRHHVRVARGQTVAAAAAAPAAATTASTAANTAPSSAAETAKSHPGAVTSPMVGTVYVAPEPGAAPFIKEGDVVKEGQTLLLIEAMKTMNPIRAPRAGKVAQIFATNAAPVEYGEVLLIIE